MTLEFCDALLVTFTVLVFVQLSIRLSIYFHTCYLGKMVCVLI